MSQWVLPTTRWAIYLRDGLSCVYCQLTLADLLVERGENFLTLDHIKAKKHGGCNSLHNLVTCCYSCNSAKGRSTVARFCREQGLTGSTVRSRIQKRRARDIGRYRLAAKLLLGRVSEVPGIEIAQVVIDHDWIVKRQWGDSIDGDYWDHLKEQEELFCPTCSASRVAREESESDLHANLSWEESALRVTDWNRDHVPF